MEGYDIISDSYSAEVISLMLLERAWSKISTYLDAKTVKKEEAELQERLSQLEKKIDINTALDRERHGKGKNN